MDDFWSPDKNSWIKPRCEVIHHSFNKLKIFSSFWSKFSEIFFNWLHINFFKLSTQSYTIFNGYVQFPSSQIDFLLVLSFESRKVFSGCHRLCLVSVFWDFAAFWVFFFFLNLVSSWQIYEDVYFMLTTSNTHLSKITLDNCSNYYVSIMIFRKDQRKLLAKLSVTLIEI